MCGHIHNKYLQQQTCISKAGKKRKKKLVLGQPQNPTGLCHCPCTCHEGRGRSGLIFPLILNLGTIWRWVVSFMTWLFYASKNSSTHCVGPTAGLDILSGVKSLAAVWNWTSDRPAHSLVTILTELPWLSNHSIMSIILQFL
jgi:hypothetical protein